MNLFCRLPLPLMLALVMTGCSTIHNSVGPENKQSELNDWLTEPTDLASSDGTAFCPKPELVVAKVKPLVRIPEPYNAKLFFLLDKVEFTAESEKDSIEVYQEIIKRKPTEISISGHTDTAASNAYNDDLSHRRAVRVRQDLINAGIAADTIKISSEGETRLLVSTPDETVEVINRRVEITLR